MALAYHSCVCIACRGPITRLCLSPPHTLASFSVGGACLVHTRRGCRSEWHDLCLILLWVADQQPPLLCEFGVTGVPFAAGKVQHQHTGGNKAKLEYYLREAIGDSGESVYPPHQLSEKELADKARASMEEGS